MDINGWLTVITVIIAIFALIPKEDRILSFQQIRNWEKCIVFSVVFFLIPYLILFPKFLYRCSFLEIFCSSNGFESSNIAFGLIYLSSLWLVFRLFWWKQNLKVDPETIDYFVELLNEKQYEEFFKIFIKYNSVKKIYGNWNLYRPIFFHPKFLNGVIVKEPSYLLQFWDKFSNEKDFQLVFRLFLENENSAYYMEIKEHWNNYSLLSGKQFLNKVLNEDIEQSIQNGLLKIVTDFTIKHLKDEHDEKSIYSREHYSPKIGEDEGFDLPLFYHIRFIGLLYNTVIQYKIDISEFRYKNMQYIYSGMVDEMINNIIVVETDKTEKDSTNYHWMIREIFSLSKNWLTTFNDEENFESNSSYIQFIPNSISHCLDELYTGFEKRKISQDFIMKTIFFYVMSDYFQDSLNDKLKSEIENNIISKIPRQFQKPTFNYALDQIFAINYEQLLNNDFGRTNAIEQNLLIRFREFLIRQNNLQ